MIKFENTEVVGWEAAIRGMRNPMNSWEKSDSDYQYNCRDDIHKCKGGSYRLGPNDHDLMMRLAKAGTDHRKFMRMIVVYVDITAPLYWWKEFDTYKVGTVANSCSTMHKIADKEFTLEDFSCEHLDTGFIDSPVHLDDAHICTETGDSFTDYYIYSKDLLEMTIKLLNMHRNKYLECDRKIKGKEFSGDESAFLLKEKQKQYWWQMIQLLPSSYNQKRTIMLNYEVLANIYKSRKNHKLDEWAEHGYSAEAMLYPDIARKGGFCDWIKTLPYYELITGKEKEVQDTAEYAAEHPEWAEKIKNMSYCLKEE